MGSTPFETNALFCGKSRHHGLPESNLLGTPRQLHAGQSLDQIFLERLTVGCVNFGSGLHLICRVRSP